MADQAAFRFRLTRFGPGRPAHGHRHKLAPRGGERGPIDETLRARDVAAARRRRAQRRRRLLVAAAAIIVERGRRGARLGDRGPRSRRRRSAALDDAASPRPRPRRPPRPRRGTPATAPGRASGGKASVRDPGPGGSLARRRRDRASRRTRCDGPLAERGADRPARIEPRPRPSPQGAARRAGCADRWTDLRLRGWRRGPPARLDHGCRDRDGTHVPGRLPARASSDSAAATIGRHRVHRRRIHGYELARHDRRLASRPARAGRRAPPVARPLRRRHRRARCGRDRGRIAARRHREPPDLDATTRDRTGSARSADLPVAHDARRGGLDRGRRLRDRRPGSGHEQSDSRRSWRSIPRRDASASAGTPRRRGLGPGSRQRRERDPRRGGTRHSPAPERRSRC